ncbi:MAG: Rrf2 family transcriptional regulator [Acidobacteriia bacterium]|nr:Rrf2 family transcriptional regulator [Terriglobia bacterium]
MFQLTRASDYALRVMTRLAEFPRGNIVHLPALAYSENIPSHFLSKILQQLTHARFIKSHRGAAGGYSLEKDPAEISLLDVIEAIEGSIVLNQCLTPGIECERMSWCSIHEVCAEARASVLEIFRRVTLKDVLLKNRSNREAIHPASVGKVAVV